MAVNCVRLVGSFDIDTFLLISVFHSFGIQELISYVQFLREDLPVANNQLPSFPT